MGEDEKTLAGLVVLVDKLDEEIKKLREVPHSLRNACQLIVREFEISVRSLQMKAEQAISTITMSRPAAVEDIEKRLRKVEDELLANRSKGKLLADGWGKVWSIIGPIVVAALVVWLKLR
jgi:hypothetical protein